VELLDNQFTNLWLYPIKLGNQAADRFFYDVGNLEPSEWERLSPLAELKGTIIVVSPHSARREDKLRHYKSALRFMIEEGDGIKAIAVAGVGSSVLGTASLARSVADSTGWDVAGIVTGYGLADLVVESLGGFFYYGEIDRLRYEFELILDRLLTPVASAPQAAAGDGRRLTGLGYPLGSWDALGNSDVHALYDVLLAGPPRLRLLVGHSKGNLLLSFVLNHMKDELGDRASRLRESRHPLFDYLTVVTLGAVVDIPTDAFAMETHQFLGQLDWLGQLNSDRSPPFFGAIAIEHEMIPGAGHHLNPMFPCSLCVADALRRAGLPHPEDLADSGRRTANRTEPRP
jgi:hypothetical protein